MTDTDIIASFPQFIIRRERASDASIIENLLDNAFGPQRQMKTTYRFRDNVSPVDKLSYVAVDMTGKLVGTIRFWPLQTESGDKLLLLGPLAVSSDFAGHRCGLALMEVGIKAARNLGEKLIVLIGDEIYYGKVGFLKVPVNHFIFPGLVDNDRVLAFDLQPSSLQKISGPLHPFKD